ncbi:MAG: hypothetical protein ILA30_07270 [Selenomonas sp.]|nr:hypothetical protein [Selenomonas sp.]
MQKQAKIIAALGLMGVLFTGTGMAVPVAAAAPAAQTASADSTQAAVPYVYTSKEYGYTINCPKKPNVIPADAIYENKKGEVLIFDNEGYTIKNAWVIIKDAFEEKSMPDLNKINEEEAKKYCSDLMSSNGYEAIELISRTKKDKAIYAITAKEIEIDSNGDGKPDMTAKADTQMAVTFFRGNKGGRYSIQLIDNPELRNSAIALFQKGVTTFKEK